MKTILSIDDNSSTQNDIRNAISEKFNFVSIKDNFDKITVENIKQIDPDLILLDIQLCGQNDETGIEIARKLRQNKIEIPIIIFSLRSKYKNILMDEKCCNIFLQKPCDIEQILAEIEDLL